MMSKRYLLLMLSFSSSPSFCMSVAGAYAWASKVFTTEAPKLLSPKSAAAKEAADEKQKKIDAAYDQLCKAQKKLTAANEQRREAGFCVSDAVDDYTEPSFFDFTSYSKVVSAQKKRAALSAARLDKEAVDAGYSAVLSEFHRAHDAYYYAKTGILSNSAPLPYEPPPFIPAKPQPAKPQVDAAGK